jgi:hypothetical protein
MEPAAKILNTATYTLSKSHKQDQEQDQVPDHEHGKTPKAGTKPV